MNQQERWQLSGTAPEFYDRYVRLLMDPWVHCLLEIAQLQPGERVLDVACGTGFVARLAARHVGAEGRVVGADLNTSMIEAARAASRADEREHIEWRTADAAALPFENGAFDAVLCQQGVQFFPDRVAALRDMHRVLRQGGRLAFTVWSAIQDTPYLAALAEVFERHVGPEAGRMQRAVCALADPDELRHLVTSAGFHDVRVRSMIKTTRLKEGAESAERRSGSGRKR